MEVVDPAPHFGSLSREHRTLGEPEEAWRSLEQQSGTDGEKWELVDVVLSGGAPWGFTLRGGLEYQEPLIITKVEEGSRAASAQLQVGDEIVSINAVPLSGYRQEAICLVKSSYRTLALGLKRRNEPFCRPHSWHSSKVSENPSEVCESDATAELAPIWQTKYDAGSPSAKDFTNCWGQPNLRQVSCKFSSVGNMESLERSSNKPQIAADQSLAVKGLCKHDSSYSPPDSNSSRSGTTPTDCMFYRGSPSSPRHRYLQIPVSNGGRVSPRIEDQTSSRFSSSGRLNLNPVWHVPEKSAAAHSPPPPPPPLRSDSFAATKVHEKGLVIPYPHGPPPYSHQKSHGKGADRQFGDYSKERGPESRRSYNAASKKDVLHVYLSPEDYNPNQLNPNKLFSLSSTDVRQGQNPFACQPQHQRQHSDEGPFYLHPRNTTVPKTQTVGTYYRSLQHLPTNAGAQNHTRSSTASPSCTAPDNNHDGMAHFRYYCITAQQPTQEASEERVEDGWRLETEATPPAVTDWNSQKAIKAKYPSPYLQPSENKNSNTEFCKQTLSPPSLEATSPGLGPMMVKSSSGEKEKENPWKKESGIADNHQNKHLHNHQANHQANCATTAQRNAQKDPWFSSSEHKICPQKTPLLHSLAQESKFLANSNLVTTNGSTIQETPDPSSGKLGRRSDRYATTLRNEIQEKRAQLQKSRSAAALSCPGETDEDAGVWKSTETSTSSSDGSFTNTYKDHLKEAQARVLQATSFKRRDLELPGNEAVSSQASVKADSTCGQVFRIGCRKRFPMDKRVHSFSEPDKINEVGMEEKKSPHQTSVGSFVDRCKFFEGASRPAFSKPIPKKSSLSPSEDVSGDKNKLASFGGENDRKVSSKQQLEKNKSGTAAEEQQRLGTFAEYEATWNLQKKSTEGRTSSRYRSAENILDSGAEERNSSVCIHERSRSSPSADFYGGVNQPAEKCMTESNQESKLDQQERHINSTSEGGHCQLNISEPLDLSPGSDSEHKDTPTPLHSNHTTKASSLLPPYPHHLHLHDAALERLLPPDNTQGPAPPKPAHPREDVSKQPETTCPSNSLEELPSLGHSPEKDPHPAAVPGPERRLENDKPFCTVAPPATPHSSSPRRSAEATVPSECLLQKLTDKNLANMQHEDLLSNILENSEPSSTVVKNVPTLVVHADSNSETENRHFLAQREVPGGPGGTANHQLCCRPCSPELSSSLCHDYTHQGPHRDTDCSASEVQAVVGATLGDTETETETAWPNAASSGHSEEDEKREELVKDIMGKDKSLVDILDQSKMKTTMDLMEGIYPQGEQILEGAQQRKKSGPKQTSPKTTQERRVDENMAAPVSLVTSSSYYSTSAPKAELLIKMKDMQEQMKEQDSEDELDIDLSSKKQELIDSLSKKLQVLREARESLQEDVQDNNALGEEVEATVQSVCKPNELDKFRMFVGDLDKVVSLLLSLSGRLARVENALNNLEEGTLAEEKRTLVEKRKLLIRQHEDAKELKENLDRRERLVYDILASHLSVESLADYQHFVKMKSALIIEQRKLEDRIKLGEEQLKCLKDSLPLEQRLRY
ncbi:protein Shroom2-like isoform X2 [Astyanax mexicanus]|uniref:Protein Shroom2-like isoform X2 n=2 Tax=Astyanax mexicanus TaxID=7994 RepID=A0A8T2LDN9_ASTMX|nr:protein Shroom2-like isoform X2 [Astyanax mexicanus]